MQFAPSDLKLLGSARMVKAIEPRVLERDVEAADKRASGSQLRIGGIQHVRSEKGRHPYFFTLPLTKARNKGARSDCGQSGTARPIEDALGAVG